MRTFFSTAVVVIVIVAACSAVIVSCKSDTSTAPPATNTALTVHSTTATTSPVLDGDGSDAAWSSVEWTTVRMKPVPVAGNTLTGEFDLTIKSVHTADTVYFIVQYPDGQPDETPNRLHYNGGGILLPSSWTNEMNGQDGVSIMWDMMADGKSARDPGGKFSDSAYGCTAACHVTRDHAKFFDGGMYPDTGSVDLWFWQAGTTNPQGYADDQFAIGADTDGVTDDNSHRFNENSEVFFTDAVYSEAKPNFPDVVAGGSNNGLDKSKFTWYGSAVSLSSAVNNPATGAPWVAGDMAPGWALRLLNQFSGQADVRAKGKHAGGKWTVEFKRVRTNLYTDQDVQFGTASDYSFSIATHDNARKYKAWEYRALSNATQPSHYGCVPRRILLKID